MLSKLRNYIGKNLLDFRRYQADKQVFAAMVASAVILIATVSFFMGAFQTMHIDMEGFRKSLIVYVPLAALTVIVMVSLPILHKKPVKNWKSIEILTYLITGILPFWAVWVMYMAIEPGNSVNLLLWAICMVALSSAICTPPLHNLCIFLLSTALLFILCGNRFSAGEFVNSIFLMITCIWSSFLRFRNEFKAYKTSVEKEAFVARISHEIRTPINAVLGTNELIQRETKESFTKEHSDDIKSAGTMLLSIVNDILDISKLSAGKMEIIPDVYSLTSLVDDMSKMIGFRVSSSYLSFSCNIDDKLPDKLIGDEVRVKQIVMNLLTNAVKYTDKGCVTLSVSGKEKDDVVYVSFAVKDTGIGIKENDIEKLKNSFYRVEGKRNHRVEGTGLGLNIVSMLVDAMDGEMNISSEYGSGSEFTVTIPQKKFGNETVGEVKAFDDVAETFENNSSFEAPDAHVLVVDDTRMNLKLMSGLLKYTKVHVALAISGEQALELCSKMHFDLIFLDHLMPVMDGIETLKAIREESEANRETPVIALTANELQDGQEQYRKYGFADYLSKPVDVIKLEKELKTYLPKELIHTLEK